MAGLVILALAWSGEPTYVDMARGAGAGAGVLFVDRTTGAQVAMDIEALAAEHRAWASYVTGGTGAAPAPGRFYTADEVSHMEDVRRVFDGAKILVPAGMFVMAIRMYVARARGLASLLQLMRDGAVVAALAVAGIGLVAALAFDAAFLLFHQLFFPQGNFLFDPATSNLIRLYPDWYWQGITFRIGLSFVALCAAVALAAGIALRGPRSTRLAAA
jgi:integral membrane protein (TIGR01906 family)